MSPFTLVTTEKRRNCLVLSEPNYQSTECFTETFLATEMRKPQITMHKPVYLGLSILEISKIVIYEFSYNYVRPKYGKKQIIFIKTLQKMLKQGLTLHNWTDHCRKERISKALL